MPSPYEESATFFKRAVLAGVLGGVAMAMTAVAFAAARGTDLWLPLKVPASILYLGRALEPGYDAGPAVVGVALHLLISIAWATIFGFLVYGLSAATTLLLGPLWGLVTGAAMVFVAFPLLGLTRVRADMPVVPTIVEHLVFGLFVGLGFSLHKYALRPHHPEVPAGREARAMR